MPWSSQSGGGGGGWKPGNGNDGGPWGQGSGGGSGGGGGGGRGPNQPDLEELLKRSQDKLKNAMPGGGMSGGLLAILLLGGLVVAGALLFTVRVQPEERGIVLRFGEYVRSLEPGLNFRLPYPVEQVFLPKVTRVNRVEVGFRGRSSRFDSSGGVTDRESLMLTGDENIVDIDFVVLWAIKDAEKYLFNIQNPVKSVKEVAEGAMREVVGRNEIQPILTQERGKTESQVKELMQSILDSYNAGIDVRAVQLQQVDPPKEVIDAFRDVQAARADQERLQNEAQAYANRVVPEARGQVERIKQASEAYKEQTIAEAEGQADRFTKIFSEYQKAPDVTRRRMFLETMERVLGGTDKIILDGKNGSGVVPYLPLNELNKAKPAGN